MVTAQIRTPILRRSLHDELAIHLRDAIAGGSLKPGEKLAELELCHRFSVSRTPLREALKVLAAEGLVTITPNRGARVAQITEQEVAELFPIMGALEALGGELAAIRMTLDGREALKAKHARMIAHYEAGERAPYLRLNEDIHASLMQASGNAALFTQWQSLMVRIKRVRFTAQMSQERWAQAVRDHEDMMEALAARDGERLSAILKRHVGLKADTVRETLSFC